MLVDFSQFLSHGPMPWVWRQVIASTVTVVPPAVAPTPVPPLPCLTQVGQCIRAQVIRIRVATIMFDLFLSMFDIWPLFFIYFGLLFVHGRLLFHIPASFWDVWWGRWSTQSMDTSMTNSRITEVYRWIWCVTETGLQLHNLVLHNLQFQFLIRKYS